jgi:hypothetical protein
MEAIADDIMSYEALFLCLAAGSVRTNRVYFHWTIGLQGHPLFRPDGIPEMTPQSGIRI